MMENGNRIEEVLDEIVLPEPIIHHIQSFLRGKEAAQTTILSKSWNSAWLTRPDLVFDERDYRIRGVCDPKGFHAFAKKTIQRYQELNLKIKSCRIFINDISVGKELMVKAMKVGAVDLHFETEPSRMVKLPHEVLESENLIRLSVTCCNIDGTVNWPSLEFLSLYRVCIEGDKIWDIISSCPLMEKLVLVKCKFIVKFQAPNFVQPRRRRCCIALNHTQFTPFEFRKLKSLSLQKVKISSLFFCDFSLKFPCLKGLAVLLCFGYKEVQINSPTLKSINFAHKRILRAKFDVPSICEFNFYGVQVPCLAFERA